MKNEKCCRFYCSTDDGPVSVFFTARRKYKRVYQVPVTLLLLLLSQLLLLLLSQLLLLLLSQLLLLLPGIKIIQQFRTCKVGLTRQLPRKFHLWATLPNGFPLFLLSLLHSSPIGDATRIMSLSLLLCST